MGPSSPELTYTPPDAEPPAPSAIEGQRDPLLRYVILLKSVDLPTFGRPASTTDGSFCDMFS